MPCNGRKTKKLNIIAGLLNGRLIAPTTYGWNTNAKFFLTWLEWFLMPLLRVGSVIIMDNASFHKKADVHRIVALYGCRAIFLPPYSPDKNPIEKKWANLKNWLRIYAKSYGDLLGALGDYFKSD